MPTLLDIQSQIDKLQQQAQKIKEKEFASTVQEILAKMQAYGITEKDLRVAAGNKTPKASKTKASKSAPKKTSSKANKGVSVAPKYQGPNGETWTGRGLTPKWLSAAIADGKQKDDYLITKPEVSIGSQ